MTEKNKNTECEKCTESLNGWKRALADYDNLKKDLHKEKDIMKVNVTERIVYELLPIIDNFDQAIKHKPDKTDQNVEMWLQGVEHVKTQLENMFIGMGVESFGVVDEVFDENIHEAVGESADKSIDDGKILEVKQSGWKINKKIIRPAKVIINNTKKQK